MPDKLKPKKFLHRKRLLGLILGLLLAIIVLKVDKKLWLPLELETINGRNNSASKTTHQPSPKNIVLILIDDKTQFLLRQNGMPIKDFEKRGRDLIRAAIEKLEIAKVKAIGLNLNLNTSYNYESDELLAATISKHKNIVLADSISSYPSPLQQNNILKSAAGIGYGELYSDYDKNVHKIKLIEAGYKETPAFSYALFKTVSKKNDVITKTKNKNEFFLKYFKSPFHKYSFIDLLQDKLDLETFKNKTVIIGIATKSKLIKDQLYNPLTKNELVSDSEVQATAVANLTNNSYLLKFSLTDAPIGFIILSILLGMIFSSIPATWRILSSAFLFVALFVYSQVLYNSHQILVELAPIVFVLLGNLVIGSLVFLQLNLQEQNIELEEAFIMLQKRSKELETSQLQLKGKNTELTLALNELHEKVNEIREVRKQLSGRREEERKRIARELHDDTLARITDLKRYIESIINSSNTSVQIKQTLGVAIQTLDNVTQETRRVINALRPSMLDNALGLIPAIENLLDELSKRSNYKILVKLTTKLSKLKLSESDEIHLYRIIQEALNNVLKHSSATKVEISITEQPGQILFLIKDNGVGFRRDLINHATIKRFGLVDMKERTELIGAKLQYLTKLDSTGTILEITIPSEKIIKAEEKTLVTS